MWTGWLWLDGRWQAQPSTRSPDLGTCSRKLDVLADAAGVPCTHQMMTGGRAPTVVPPERPARQEETRLDFEGDDP